MIFAENIILPINGTIDSETTKDLTVIPGTITNFQLFIPPGHAGLTYLRILHGGFQVLPINPNKYFRGDNLHLSFATDLRLEVSPYVLTLSGYNTDDTYQHEFFVWLDIDIVQDTLEDIQRLIADLG